MIQIQDDVASWLSIPQLTHSHYTGHYYHSQ